jgi:two-component system response regulator PilR (NtrC family)
MSVGVLLIDDEDVFREDLATLLRVEGFVCRTASDGEEGLRLAEEAEPDVVVCDLVMPGIGGVDVVDRLATIAPDTPVILLTAYGTMETALEAFRKGATDYLLKPVDLDELIHKVERVVEHRRLEREVRYLRREVSEARAGSRLVGDSAALAQVRRLIEKVAPVDSTVLLTGESGTGKELAARSIHEAGPRSDGPFVAVNCAALPRELVESELFGHVRGAFTGAHKDRPGHFELARHGTLFLDEIAELPLELQPKLLRAIEQKEVLPVGATAPVRTNARIVAATNRRLEEEIEAGRFREDLYFRLRVVEIRLPALRERREDVPVLVEHFVRRLNPRLKRRVLGVDGEAIQALMEAPWRGNVRELENVLERAMILSEDDTLGIDDLPADLVGRSGASAPAPVPDDLRQAARAFERQHVSRVLREAGGNREEAARRLGIDASTLYRRLKELEEAG